MLKVKSIGTLLRRKSLNNHLKTHAITARIQYEHTSALKGTEEGWTQNSLCCLSHSKALIKLEGNDAPNFIKSLAVDRQEHTLTSGASYVMFLSRQKKVLFDAIVYNLGKYFLIECDKKAAQAFEKRFNLHERKVHVTARNINDIVSVWALSMGKKDLDKIKLDLQKNNINLFRDPRLGDLGCRLLTDACLKVKDFVELLGGNVKVKNEQQYKILRYQLGVSEGVDDLIPGFWYPTEANGDYLQGIYLKYENFDNINDERQDTSPKRIMPLKFSQNIEDCLGRGSEIRNERGQVIGNLIGSIENFGLGVMDVKKNLNSSDPKIQKYSLRVTKPNWWMKSAEKYYI